ncbi:uncharacterized protein LOC107426792 [Ziziphus jujuba]|uniref:Uncharacterized protein LOC107426792 n=1 Tax=Ziziphus jujuba TaxID=326968 RepID=A0A6P4AC46_ZIZJJ|nr:uncharacterized protein LOC107426792 [Ziziphus jujuba]
MDPIPSSRCGARRPCVIHHHHHHHHHCNLVVCPHQHQHCQIHCFCNCHRHAIANPNFAYFPQNPQFIPPCSFPNDLTSGFEEPHRSAQHHQMLKEQENAGFEEEDDDDDDDPVFVLTDEWKEFFAKSEAERKLKKKQANKEKK